MNWKKRLLFILIFILAFGGASYFQFFRVARASQKVITEKIDFESGSFNGVEAEGESGSLNLEADGQWGPKYWSTPGQTLTYGTAIGSDGDYVYVLTGRDNYFTRYRPNENRWEDLATPLHWGDQGADMVVLGNYIYVIWGGYQKDFSRYSIINNSWEDLDDAPDLIYGGGSIETDGTDLYVLRGYTTTEFWKYDILTEEWSDLPGTPATIYYGADLNYYDGYLYTPRGYNQKTFYRYDIENGDWETLPDSTIAFYDVHNMDEVDGYIYGLQDRATNTFYRYDIGGTAWETLTTTPETTRYVGLVYNDSDDMIYVFRGNGQRDMWKYDRENDVFLGPDNLPAAPGTGADLLYNNNYLYYLRGGSTSFYRYNVGGTGNWDTMATAPATISDDTKGVAANGSLYFFRGGGTNSFYKYDTGSGSWGTMPTTPAIVRYGGALAYPGSGDYLYATAGNYTRSFWRYSIGSSQWDDAGATDLPDDAEASYGARLIADGGDSDTLYYISGSRTAEILKYSIGTTTWTDIGNLPYAPYYGTDVIYFNNKLYIQAGWNKADFWEFELDSGPDQYTWRRMPNLSTYNTNELGPYNGGSLETDGSSFYSIWGRGFTGMQVFTPSGYSYKESGVWESNVIDLDYVGAGTTMTMTVGSTIVGNSEVIVETKTSEDMVNWSNWETVIDGVIQSSSYKYIKLKVTLNASDDRLKAPTVNSIVISYEGDEKAPNNPTSIEGRSRQINGQSITSGETYNYINPYFSWSGASDDETEVVGYYVYFGVGETADPEDEGVYQSTTSYLSTTELSSGNYYLRIKTKDILGNVSEATTGFIYVYSGVEKVSLPFSNTDEFTGIGTSVLVNGNEIKLHGKDGFWEEDRLSNALGNIYYGSGMAYRASTNKLYVMAGSNSNLFWSYDIDSDTWTALATTPETVTYGGDLVEGPDGYLYAFRGGNTTDFWRYEIGTDEWIEVTDANQPVYYGSSLVYDGDNYVYALRGNNDNSFWRYDVVGDSWESLADTDFGAPDSQRDNFVYYGGDLAYDGMGTIYAIQGNYKSGFASYSITSDEWTLMDNLPALAYAGSQIEYDTGSNAIYFLDAYQNYVFFKYDLNTREWVALEEAPTTMYYGCTMRSVNGDLYITRGYNSSYFYKYDIDKSKWSIPQRGLFEQYFRGTDYNNFNYGADIVKGAGNYYYLTVGNYNDLFVRWDSSTGETLQLTDIPASFYVGGALGYDNVHDKIYAVASQYSRKLLEYDVATDRWSEVTTDPLPTDPSTGTAFTFDGVRYLYWTKGGSTSFYRYDTLGDDGSRWEQLGNVPGSLGYGSAMVYRDGGIYTLRGNGVNPNPLYKFDVGTTSWDTLSSVSSRIYNDGFLVDGAGDSLYACRGEATKDCFKYSISNDSWSAIENAPDNIRYGGAAASSGTDKLYMIAGNGSVYADGLYSYVMETDNSSFEEEGNYISQSHDLGSIYQFANLSLTYTAASNATLTIYTRTSDDNDDWDDWVEVMLEKNSGDKYWYKINSATNRYLQVKFDLTSGDGVYSGKISDYTINYYQDIDKPTSHSSLIGYTDLGMGTTMTNGNWSGSIAPYFDWPEAEAVGGANDGSTGSGIEGYYVYFGTTEVADPEVLGTYTTATSFTGSGMTGGQQYYLRVKAKDMAGNVATDVGTTFVYGFDNVRPSNPTTISSDPPGYTATNNFTFTWSGAEDIGSGIASYCYKVGVGGSETCLLGAGTTGVTGIEASGTGTNTFFLKTKDMAGNYASDWASSSFYYSSTAPGAPKNLSVGQSSNDVNDFSFSWQAPDLYYGQQSGLRYYYSINELPSASNVNTVGLSVTYLSSGAYATRKGENTLYVLVMDEAGNIDYNNYSAVNFYAETSSPGIPQNIDISDVSVKETSNWRLAISWETPEASGSGVANYKVYRASIEGAVCSSDMDNFSLISSTTSESFVDTNLRQSEYSYCVKACDSTNECSAVSDTVALLPDGKWRVPPTLLGEPEAEVKTKSATITWSTNRTASSFVKYGTGSGEYGEEVGTSDQLSAHEIDLSGLEPGTTYYYKTLWTDEDGNTGESEEGTFSTNPAPVVSTVKISDVSLYSAYVTFVIKNSTKISVQYGKTVSYGESMELSTSVDGGENSLKIEDLEQGTEYHLRIQAFDEEDNVFISDDYIFETLPLPKLVNAKIQQVKGMPTATIRLLWQSNTDVSSIVTYYPAGRPELAKDQIKLTLLKNHVMVLNDLLDDTEYLISIKGKDVMNNSAETVIQKFKTSTDLRSPTVSNLTVETVVSGVGEEAKAQVVVYWDTDEPATSQIEYGQGTGNDYPNKTQKDSNFTLNHSVTITDLTPSQVYHLRVLTEDKVSNLTKSYDNVVITPKATKSALNLVIENLSKSFGFVSNLSGVSK